MDIKKFKTKACDLSLNRGERRRAYKEIVKHTKKEERVKKMVHVKMNDGTTIELYRSMRQLKDLRRRNEPIKFVLEGDLHPHNESNFQRIIRKIKQFLFNRKYKLGANNERGFTVHWEDINTFYSVK